MLYLFSIQEQRESLKNQGHKHEDDIMKENAKLQVIIILIYMYFLHI